jgi:hypothetical protein
MKAPDDFIGLNSLFMVQPKYHPVIENLHWEIVMEQSSTECKVHKTVAVGGYGRRAPKILRRLPVRSLLKPR